MLLVVYSSSWLAINASQRHLVQRVLHAAPGTCSSMGSIVDGCRHTTVPCSSVIVDTVHGTGDTGDDGDITAVVELVVVVVVAAAAVATVEQDDVVEDVDIELDDWDCVDVEGEPELSR
uniref:Uncharacterized protein n=1 Tax=Anopheles maculatus TaxID=74869 RepID=A0A182SEY7_9DIPT